MFGGKMPADGRVVESVLTRDREHTNWAVPTGSLQFVFFRHSMDSRDIRTWIPRRGLIPTSNLKSGRDKGQGGGRSRWQREALGL